MRESRRRGGGEQRNEPALREPPDVMAEHPGGEAMRRRDRARVLGRLRQLRVDDRRKREVAERTSTLPAFEAVRREHSLRLRAGVEVGQRLEPGDPRVAVPELAAPFRVVEVAEERLHVGVGEAERRDPARASSGCTRAEPQHRPAALGGDASELAVGVDRNRVADDLQKGQVRVAVGVRRGLGEVVPTLVCEPRTAVALCSPCSERTLRPV